MREGWPNWRSYQPVWPAVSKHTSHAISHSQERALPLSYALQHTPTRQRLDRGDVKTRRTREPLFDAAHKHSLLQGRGSSKQTHEQSWTGGGDGVLTYETWKTRPRARQSMKHPRTRLHAQP